MGRRVRDGASSHSMRDALIEIGWKVPTRWNASGSSKRPLDCALASERVVHDALLRPAVIHVSRTHEKTAEQSVLSFRRSVHYWNPEGRVDPVAGSPTKVQQVALITR